MLPHWMPDESYQCNNLTKQTFTKGLRRSVSNYQALRREKPKLWLRFNTAMTINYPTLIFQRRLCSRESASTDKLAKNFLLERMTSYGFSTTYMKISSAMEIRFKLLNRFKTCLATTQMDCNVHELMFKKMLSDLLMVSATELYLKAQVREKLAML